METLKQWTESEMKFALNEIKRWFNSRDCKSREGKLPHFMCVQHMETVLGLPYTSSGRAACVSITNTEVYLDVMKEWRIYCFEMEDSVDMWGRKRHSIFAICYNDKEDELIIKIN